MRLFPKLLLACAVAVLSGGPALAKKKKKKKKGGAIRNAKTLAKRQAVAEKKLVKEHVAFAKKLEKAKAEWEQWYELKLVLRLDPGHKRAKRLLPDVQPVLPDKMHPGFDAAHGAIVKLAREELGAVLDRGVRGKLDREALAPVALALLSYDPDCEPARAALGFAGRSGRWRRPREVKVQGRFSQALKKVPEPKLLKAAPFPELQAALGLRLIVYQSPHCYAAGVEGSATTKELTTIAKAAEVAYAAMHADLLGVPNSVFGGERQATGVKLAKFRAPLLLMLDNQAQHLRFLKTIVTNKDLKIAGRSLTFVSTWFKPEKILVCDSSAKGKFLQEWPAQRMAFQVLLQRFGRNRPTYLTQGLARYYSSHASREARIRTVPLGSKSRDKTRTKAGDYSQLRTLARWAIDNFRTDPPATLGLYKTLNSMNRSDNAVATAFVDFLLATRKGALVKLLHVADSKKQAVDEAYKQAFPDETTQALDEAFSTWFFENY